MERHHSYSLGQNSAQNYESSNTGMASHYNSPETMRRARKKKASPEQQKPVEEIDLNPYIGEYPLAVYDDIRASIDNSYDADDKKGRKEAAVYAVDRLLPIIDENEPGADERWDERDALYELLNMEETRYQQATASVRPSAEDISRVWDARRASGEAQAIEGEKLGGLVGRLGENGFNARILQEIGKEYDEYLPDYAKDSKSRQPVSKRVYTEGALYASEDMINDLADSKNFKTEDEKNEFSVQLFNDISKYLRYNEKARREVEVAVNVYHAMAPDPVEEEQLGILRRMGDKLSGFAKKHELGDKLDTFIEKSESIISGLSANLREGLKRAFDRMKNGKERRAGETSVEHKKRTQENGRRALGAAGLFAAGERPGIFRRVRDRIFVDTGIAMATLWNRKEQRGDETNEDYQERMRKTGKFTTGAFIGAAALYGMSRLAPGLEFLHGHGPSGNTVATANEALGSKGATPTVSPETTGHIAGGGHTPLEEQLTPTEKPVTPPKKVTPPTEVVTPVTTETKPKVATSAELFTRTPDGTVEFTSAGLNDLEKSINGYKVESGDSVWNVVKEYLKEEQGIKKPTNAQVAAATNRLLPDLRAQGLVDSRDFLQKGVTIKLK